MLCVYQVLMGGIELLKDLVHDGVGEIGNHWQLYFSAEDWVRGKGETDGKKLGKSESKSIFFLSNSDLLLLLQRLTYSKALWMSCAALSIRAVRMAERGMDTRSETDERGGLNLSAAEEDRGQSSRHRDTMESTITCNGCQRSVTLSSVTHQCQKKRLLDVPAAPCQQLWQVRQPRSRVSAAPAHPQTAHERAHTVKGRAWSTTEKGFIHIQCDNNANTTLAHFTSLTAREFLASFSTCFAAWISSISPTPRNKHTCCWTRTQRRSITLETDRRGSVTSANTHKQTQMRAHADEPYLFGGAGDQALMEPQSLSLREALSLVVPHQSTLDLCGKTIITIILSPWKHEEHKQNIRGGNARRRFQQKEESAKSQVEGAVILQQATKAS